MWQLGKLRNLKKTSFLSSAFILTVCLKENIKKKIEKFLKIVLVLSPDPAHVQEFVVDTARSS